METANKKPRCHHISKIGSRCMADPQAGKNYCFFHDPGQKKKQAEARKQGGEARTRQISPEITLPPDLPIVPLENSWSVFELMRETVHHLQCHKMDVRAAKAIAYLSSLLLRALKANQRLIAQLLSDTINQVRSGETDLPTAKTIGHLTSIMLTALRQHAEEQADLEPAGAARMAGAAPSNSLAKLARSLGVQFVATPIATAQPQDDHKVHPAIISGNAGKTPDHGGIQTA
jgi:hypothetical protein